MIIAERLLNSWLRDAKPGDVLVYARATYLLPNSVTRRLYDLAMSGHVCLTRTRRSHGMGMENFLYAAKRLAKPLEGSIGLAAGREARRGGGVRMPQDHRFPNAALVRELEPEVRSLLAEGVRPHATRIARMLGVYDAGPVRLVLERLAA